MRLSRSAIIGTLGVSVALSVTLSTLPAEAVSPASAKVPAITRAITPREARAQLDKLRTEQQQIEGQAADLEKRLSDTADRIDEKERDIQVQEEKIKEADERLKEIALQQYRDRDQDSLLSLMFSESSTDSFIDSLSTADIVTEYNSNLLADHLARKATLMDDKRVLDAERAQADRDFKKLEKLREEIQKKVQQAQSLYNRVDAQTRNQYYTNGQYNGTSRSSSVYVPGSGTKLNPIPAPVVPRKFFGAYAFGNCTSYVYARRAQTGRPVPRTWGDARRWAGNAAAAGYRVDRVPEVGAVYVTFGGFYGHVMYVEKVNSDGSFIISEMNYVGFNVINTRLVPYVDGQFIH